MLRRKPRAASPDQPEPTPKPSVLDRYVTNAPSDQNQIDVFAGEWSTQFPDELGLHAGGTRLLEDPRIDWVVEQMGGIDGLDVLELGPLEGGHSAMLHARGASVLAIESNTHAFLRCLITKNLLGLDRCRFELGDFHPFLRETDRRFDLVLASGVLYHSQEPIALLESMARVTDRIAVWTHYFDAAVLAEPAFRRVFAPNSDMVEWRGRTIELRRHAYLESLDWSGFCGGSEETTLWISRQGLHDVLAELGFADVRNLYEDPKHPFGPCIMLFASR
jgi:hypothetical protein